MSIIVKNLSKNFRVPLNRNFFKREYREVKAVKSISFTINDGELIGFLGPNGAGKSTTIKMLSGILVPDDGVIEVDGLIPWKERKRHAATIGVVFGQKSQLWWDLPLQDSFTLIKAIYNIPDKEFYREFKWLTEGLNITDYLQHPVRVLSLGQRMRAELAISILHNPKLLILDEPTIGLDVRSKEVVRSFIQHLNRERGTTIILTTHDMDDIEKLCNRVMLIDGGEIGFDGSIPQLRNRINGNKRVIVDYSDGLYTQKRDGITVISDRDRQLILEFNPEVISAQKLIGELSEELQIKDLNIINPPIEEIISSLYRERP